MSQIVKTILGGLIIVLTFQSTSFAEEELSSRLWRELEESKSPENLGSNSKDKQAQEEVLSPADLAFMEAEYLEDSISTGQAAPLRKKVTPKRKRKRSLSKVPTIKGSSSKSLRERSR